MSDLRIIHAEELAEFLRLHGLYLQGEQGGFCAKLSKLNLCHVRLSGAELGGANLSESDLSNADLSDANLRCVDLSDVNLSHADLRIADLTRARLVGADLSDADLNGAILRDADLSDGRRGGRSRMILTNMIRSQRLDGCLRCTRLFGADLRGADLHGADLTGAYLTRVRLVGADLREACLLNANLLGADLTDAKMEGIILPPEVAEWLQSGGSGRVPTSLSIKPTPGISGWESQFPEAATALLGILSNGTVAASKRIRSHLRLFRDLAAMEIPNLYAFAKQHKHSYDKISHHRDDLQDRLGGIKLTQPSTREGAGWNEIELSAAGCLLAAWITLHPEHLSD